MRKNNLQEHKYFSFLEFNLKSYWLWECLALSEHGSWYLLCVSVQATMFKTSSVAPQADISLQSGQEGSGHLHVPPESHQQRGLSE